MFFLKNILINELALYPNAVRRPDNASGGKQSAEAQGTYIRALKAKGVIVHLGKHRLEHGRGPRYVKDTEPSRTDKVDIWNLEEKQTDVNIAIQHVSASFTSTTIRSK